MKLRVQVKVPLLLTVCAALACTEAQPVGYLNTGDIYLGFDYNSTTAQTVFAPYSRFGGVAVANVSAEQLGQCSAACRAHQNCSWFNWAQCYQVKARQAQRQPLSPAILLHLEYGWERARHQQQSRNRPNCSSVWLLACCCCVLSCPRSPWLQDQCAEPNCQLLGSNCTLSPPVLARNAAGTAGKLGRVVPKVYLSQLGCVRLPVCPGISGLDPSNCRPPGPHVPRQASPSARRRWRSPGSSPMSPKACWAPTSSAPASAPRRAPAC
jgi:hypothetical protein